MYFKSKKDIWIYPVIWGAIVACFTPIFVGEEYEVLFLTVPFAILMIWIWFSTGYTVKSEHLILRNGPLKKDIPIKNIKSITRTFNPMASYALSINRLKIEYGTGFGFVLVSPINKQEFVTALKEINPRIQIENNIKD
ncbi:PH domain-containing protein [Priestia filamentosa]|uniref:PH domain-containing protein n=1 Tax=Priestia filamentosa TaxID=1402861 RepID=UPI00398258CB